MKKQIDLPAAIIRGAVHFQATSDVRYYLNGIQVRSDGYIHATDGSAMFRVKCDEAKQLHDSIIFRFIGTIPKKAQTAHLVPNEAGTGGYIWFTSFGGSEIQRQGVREIRSFCLIDGKYPNIENAMPSGDLLPTDQFRINADYFAKISRAAKDMGCRTAASIVMLRGPEKVIQVELKTPDVKAEIYIMPMRA